MLVVGEVQRKVDEVAAEIRNRGVEVTKGYGRKDPTAVNAITNARTLEIAAVVIVCPRDVDEEIRWQCWTHRCKSGIALTWVYYDYD